MSKQMIKIDQFRRINGSKSNGNTEKNRKLNCCSLRDRLQTHKYHLLERPPLLHIQTYRGILRNSRNVCAIAAHTVTDKWWTEHQYNSGMVWSASDSPAVDFKRPRLRVVCYSIGAGTHMRNILFIILYLIVIYCKMVLCGELNWKFGSQQLEAGTNIYKINYMFLWNSSYMGPKSKYNQILKRNILLGTFQRWNSRPPFDQRLRRT